MQLSHEILGENSVCYKGEGLNEQKRI